MLAITMQCSLGSPSKKKMTWGDGHFSPWVIIELWEWSAWPLCPLSAIFLLPSLQPRCQGNHISTSSMQNAFNSLVSGSCWHASLSGHSYSRSCHLHLPPQAFKMQWASTPFLPHPGNLFPLRVFSCLSFYSHVFLLTVSVCLVASMPYLYNLF